MLNEFTANAIGIPVVAGPSEATAIGNILLQAKAAKLVNEKEEMRKIVRDSSDLEYFEPHEREHWETGYQKYITAHEKMK